LIESADPMRRFPWGATIATAIALAILCGLGVWQLQRRVWKEHLLAQIAERQHAAPTPLADALVKARAGQDMDFTRVTVACPGIDRAPFTELYAVAEGGRAGVRLVSACKATGGGWSGVLVDRGFVDSATKARPAADGASAAPVTVTGVLRTPERPGWFTPKHGPGQPLWFSRDVPGMAATLGLANPAPLMLAAETSTNPDRPELTPSPLPAEIPNRHFEYALTWFGLALVLAGVYAAMVIKHLRGRAG
jgi:surfeit locus 1 family protein